MSAESTTWAGRDWAVDPYVTVTGPVSDAPPGMTACGHEPTRYHRRRFVATDNAGHYTSSGPAEFFCSMECMEAAS